MRHTLSLAGLLLAASAPAAAQTRPPVGPTAPSELMELLLVGGIAALVSAGVTLVTLMLRRRPEPVRGESLPRQEGDLQGRIVRMESELRRQAEELAALRQGTAPAAASPSAEIGSTLHEEFRRRCEAAAEELDGRLRAHGVAATPPVVEHARRLAAAALRVSQAAIQDASMPPALRAQLQNLGTLGSTLEAMDPLTPLRPPTTDAVRALPDRPDAEWKPEYAAGGSLEAQIAYRRHVDALLTEEVRRIEDWLASADEPPGGGTREAAIEAWLTGQLLPLLDQVEAALMRDGAAALKQACSPETRAALDEVRSACSELVGTGGLAAVSAAVGSQQQPGPGVRIEAVDRGGVPGAVVEVRQTGWSWNGRHLRDLHVLVQQEPGPAASIPPPGGDEGPVKKL